MKGWWEWLVQSRRSKCIESDSTVSWTGHASSLLLVLDDDCRRRWSCAMAHGLSVVIGHFPACFVEQPGIGK
jgi:hypothetical protein